MKENEEREIEVEFVGPKTHNHSRRLAFLEEKRKEAATNNSLQSHFFIQTKKSKLSFY